jgi:hypothetical protein
MEEPLHPHSSAGHLLEALGIDPRTRKAISPDPPSDPPGPIVVGVEPRQPLREGFVERIARIAGADIVEVVEGDDPSLLPAQCFGVIGLEMWSLQLACVARGLGVRMFETMRSFSIDDSYGVDRSWPGYKLIRPDEDWRALVDEAARQLVRLRDESSQRYVKSMLSPADPGEPTVWSRRVLGQSGVEYAFRRVLGLGGTAIVALLEDPSGTSYAAKAPSSHRLPVQDRWQWFEREGRNLAKIKHPNVVAIRDLATMDEEIPVIVMEYVEGGSVHRHLREEGRPDLKTAVHWLRDALRGTAAMHEAGMVHRDLSPKNLLLRPAGGLVVGDFGTVRHLDDATLTASVDRIGSLIYIAPEQFQAPHDAAFAADVYSLGQIGFHLLTGLTPLGNTGAARKHEERVPAGLSELIEKMRSYRAEDRPHNAIEALSLFEAHCSDFLSQSD